LVEVFFRVYNLELDVGLNVNKHVVLGLGFAADDESLKTERDSASFVLSYARYKYRQAGLANASELAKAFDDVDRACGRDTRMVVRVRE
jgi:hypothetical protein